ncbi:MAG TPA: 3-isopropylmalate dehydratase large subunit [Candidatus Sumerlaeia bacterium]|nr:MAG: 2,3-dimethylmalate dehydratase large subunit [candidate division BRC1 bacterium ADurb.Bin183]HRR31243.1 3-isopropylmalate dehydratase large subunit [Candidatus Sumerlaeia bacterium]
MGMTITEKILAEHCGQKEVRPGQLINARLDLCLANDITAPIAIDEFEKAGAAKVFDREKIALVPDHFTPNKDIKSAEQAAQLRRFARKHQIKYYFEVGEMGVEHALLPEQGIVLPGDCIIGADSHTCTYGALGAFSTGVGSTDVAAGMITGEAWFKVPEQMKFNYKGKLSKWVGGKDLILFTIGKIGVDGALYRTMNFTGPVIQSLPMEDRLALCNMAIEAGGKNGIIEPDEITEEYVHLRARHAYKFFKSDTDAKYVESYDWNVTNMEPQVAFPHLPSNVHPVSKASDITIDQVFIGSCTNGRLSDLRLAASILKGNSVAKFVRCIVIPATQLVYRQAMEEGLIAIFLDAGCAVCTPTCGPCLGGHMGILAAGERCVATSNRNFVGRMGHVKSEIYLANAAVAAASAITGRITHPEEVAK